MTTNAFALEHKSLFDLKHVAVALVPTRSVTRISDISTAALEDFRAKHRPVSASKNGLESICGVSCDTAAQ